MLMLGKWGSVYHKLVQVLQSETIFLQNRADIKRMLQNKAALRYYIVGQELLESWAVNVLESLPQSGTGITKRSNFITKWFSTPL